MAYNSYNISEHDKFNPNDYPVVTHELIVLNEGIAGVPVHHKADIIISFLKDHCLKNNWISANPKLIKLLTSGLFPVSHIESLFVSCRKNKAFLHDFEAYLKEKV